MNEIRQNRKKEEEIVTGVLGLPTYIKVIFYCLIVMFFILCINLPQTTSSIEGENDLTILFFAFFSATLFVVFIPAYIYYSIILKQSKFVVTNKRIKGKVKSLFKTKEYSYRLDEIDYIEKVSSFGIHGILVHFSKGRAFSVGEKDNGEFKIKFVKNINEVYEQLSDLLTSIKNDKDVLIDIETSKVEAEERKATAFEKMAKGVSEEKNHGKSSTYISELRELKELLNDGIINEQEFEEKKKELLSKK